MKGYTLSPEQERKAINFNRARIRQYFVGFFYGLVMYVLILRWRIGPKYRDIAERIAPGRFRQAIFYVPMVLLTLGVLNLPRSIYGHWLVRKYELSIQGWGSWAFDWLKLRLIVAIFSVFVVWLLYSVIRQSPRRWWFYFWLTSLPIIVVVLFIEPVLIEPLFYEFEPLAVHQPRLVEEIEKVTTRAGFLIPRDRMLEMKASKKLNAVNAYVTGIGASKRVVVWDTTLAKMSVPETLFVFGHEMGHYVLNHIPKGMAFAAGQIFVFLFLASRVLKWALNRWGTRWAIRDAGDWASLPLILLLVSVANFLSTPIDSSYSRRLEHEADRYGLEVIHGIVPDSPEVAAQSFQILGEIDLEEPNPSEFVKFWFYDHPPINDRILFARTYDPWSKGQAQTAPDRYQGELQPLIEKFVKQQEVPGLAIGVVEKNRLVYAHGFGVANLTGKNNPVTPRSLFHMASITKPFVATSIMQLVETGRIDLDAPVVKYVPYFEMADERYKTITVRQMLTHTSGMPDVEDYEWNKPQYDDRALERYVLSLSTLKLKFAPGTDFSYSNMAFEILGDVVAKVSGESFEYYVQHHILAPLGMWDSTLLIKQADPKLLTWGHELDASGHPFPSQVFPYNRTHSPSSNLHSNVVDMARWAMANMNRGELEGKRILKDQTYDVMWKPAWEFTEQGASARRAKVGISWFLGEDRGHATVSHSGGDTGYGTDLAMIPEKKVAVIWMANSDWIGNARQLITNAALDVALELKPEPIVIKRSVARLMTSTFRERGLEAALEQYQTLKKSQPDVYDFGEGQLNSFGYFLLRRGHTKEAIRVIQINVELYPSSAHVYESLAEAFAADGNRAMAIANYQKAFELDPKSTHSADALKKLRKPKQ